MERSQIDAAHVIPRYLAGQLSTEEASAFEEAYSRDPELVAEIERVLRIKEGLASLRDHDELSSLLRPAPRRPSWSGLATAAAVAVLAIGLSWHELRRSRDSTALATAVLSSSHSSRLPVLRSYMLAHTREATPALVVPLSARAGVIELRVLPSLPATQAPYVVRLTRLEGSTRKAIAQIDSLAAGSDRYVSIYLDQRQLSAGDYEISLTPAQGTADSQDIERFTLRVK